AQKKNTRAFLETAAAPEGAAGMSPGPGFPPSFFHLPKERSMTAEYKVHGDVAVITMSNPPVNGLGLSTRVGITDGLSKALADAAVKAIVLTGAGKAFSGGADIKEFGSPKALQDPNLLSVILALEASTKPIVAAVHSICM